MTSSFDISIFPKRLKKFRLYFSINPFQFLFDTGQSLVDNAVMPWIEDASGKEDKKRFDFLDAIIDL